MLLIFLLSTIFLSGCSAVAQNFSLPPSLSKSVLRVIYFDVGQGDSALIMTPENQTILVDGGSDDKVLSRLGTYLPLGQKKIDVMILTHPHADHLDGLVEVLKRYEVGRIYYTGVLQTTGTFLEWLKMIKEQKITLNLVKTKEDVKVGGVKLDFLYPIRDLSALGPADLNKPELKSLALSNLNNTSIVFKLIFGRTSFLFMGDAEVPVEKELFAQDADVQADVLKIGHHGSNSSTNEEFLKAVNPKYAIISVGKNNDFGHPHLRTLRRLERHGVEILRTDEMGSVELLSDGEKVGKK
ncbi:MAG: hypothetical protein A2294_03705 [Candidatus Magasanikbacteria bacterium RIFOXYB2_FULL_38_10]|nr:MAG: hypothetical protein A2294_03705 [Candidatus Magasanikbacteria bacterium RIFOXYB2_FULL_38_10]